MLSRRTPRKTHKYGGTSGPVVPIHVRNAYLVRIAMQNLHSAVKEYIVSFAQQWEWKRKKKTDPVFAEKVAYWRARGGHQLVRDEVGAFKSMADGKMYTSQSAYRKELKARNYEEVGDQGHVLREKQGDAAYDRKLREDLETTIAEYGGL